MNDANENKRRQDAVDPNRPAWVGDVEDKASIPYRIIQADPAWEDVNLLEVEEKVHLPMPERYIATQQQVQAQKTESPQTNAKRMKPEPEELLTRTKTDRRLLPHVPPRSKIRSNIDQRGREEAAKKRKRRVVNPSLPYHFGIRYEAELDVEVRCVMPNGAVHTFACKSRNISTNGMQLHLISEKQTKWLAEAKRMVLRFQIKPGVMPEGYEMRVRMQASYIVCRPAEDSGYLCGVKFKKSLVDYAYSRRGRNLRTFSIVMLIVMMLVIILMRLQSYALIYTRQFVYVYSIVTSIYLLSRYLIGALYKPVPINPDFTPGVSIVIPCFDEEEWIERTIISCLDQEYPTDKLEVIVVDDHSRDNSPQRIKETLAKLAEIDELYDTIDRVRYVRQEKNMGKRDAMARGTRMARHDLVVFVDSDSFLDPYAIVNLVQPFQDPKVGGVSGRTDVANSYTNTLTKMQSVKYYISFRVMKAVEGYFNAVTCLSGPLSCYRKEALLKNLDAWLNQRFFGQKATFGDDRSMTNFILREYRTDYQDTAVCSTIVPNKYKVFLRQQMRWKRSWFRESLIAASYIWKKEPVMAISFYIGFIIPIIAPFVVFYNMIFVPIFRGNFPTVFLIGLLAMSMLMSMTQMLMRRSKLWIYGIVYQLYYITVLIWQMPVAWVTFWKTTWGTRKTDSDLKAEQRKDRRKTSSRRQTYVEDS